MNLKKHLATVLWLGLALVASAMAAPPSPAQDHDGGVVMSFVTGEAQEDGNVSAAPAISDAPTPATIEITGVEARSDRPRDGIVNPIIDSSYLEARKRSRGPRERLGGDCSERTK